MISPRIGSRFRNIGIPDAFIVNITDVSDAVSTTCGDGSGTKTGEYEKKSQTRFFWGRSPFREEADVGEVATV